MKCKSNRQRRAMFARLNARVVNNVPVERNRKTNRITGVIVNGRKHEPKSQYKSNVVFSSAVRLKGLKRVYYYPKVNQPVKCKRKTRAGYTFPLFPI